MITLTKARRDWDECRRRQQDHRRGREDPPSHGLCPGAGPPDGRVLELRDLVLDHLHPGRRHHRLPGGVLRRRPVLRGGRLAGRRPVRAGRRLLDRPDRLGLSYRRRPLSLGLDPGWPRLWLGLRLDQHAGPGLRRGLGECRRLPAAQGPGPGGRPGHGRLGLGLPGTGDRRLPDHPDAGPVQPFRDQDDHGDHRFLRLPDPGRRRRADSHVPDLGRDLGPVAPDHVHQQHRRARRRVLRRAAHRVRGVPGRPALPGLHDHRLRRLGAHLRGDHRRAPAGAARHPALDPLVAGVRPRHGGLVHPGDPGSRSGRQGRRRRLVQPVQQPAGPGVLEASAGDRHRRRQLSAARSPA